MKNEASSVNQKIGRLEIQKREREVGTMMAINIIICAISNKRDWIKRILIGETKKKRKYNVLEMGYQEELIEKERST